MTPDQELELSDKAVPRSILVAGRDLHLPSDAFGEFCISTAACVIGGPCLEAPYYVIKRENSRISVSVRSGTVIREDVAIGEGGGLRLPEGGASVRVV